MAAFNTWVFFFGITSLNRTSFVNKRDFSCSPQLRGNPFPSFCSNILKIKTSKQVLILLLPPIRAAETVECVRKYVDGILQNL